MRHKWHRYVSGEWRTIGVRFGPSMTWDSREGWVLWIGVGVGELMLSKEKRG